MLAAQRGTIVRKDVEGLLDISQTLAGRLLKQLVEKKLLKMAGDGRARRYFSG